jgi:hypothetical protein
MDGQAGKAGNFDSRTLALLNRLANRRQSGSSTPPARPESAKADGGGGGGLVAGAKMSSAAARAAAAMQSGVKVSTPIDVSGKSPGGAQVSLFRALLGSEVPGMESSVSQGSSRAIHWGWIARSVPRPLKRCLHLQRPASAARIQHLQLPTKGASAGEAGGRPSSGMNVQGRLLNLQMGSSRWVAHYCPVSFV